MLNFGHTIGHALEAQLGYGRIRHGEAVAYGMLCAGWISNHLGILSKKETKFLYETIQKLPLPSLPKMKSETILEFVRNDKKYRNGVLQFVILEALGKGNICQTVTKRMISDSLRMIQ